MAQRSGEEKGGAQSLSSLSSSFIPLRAPKEKSMWTSSQVSSVNLEKKALGTRSNTNMARLPRTYAYKISNGSDSKS